MLSFWEKRHFTAADYLIIGGGLVGLTAAIRLRELRPSARVLVLERGMFASGASSKNAGFACFGSLSELLADWQTMGPERALQLVENRWRGLQRLEQRLGAGRIGLKRYGGYELLRQEELHFLDKITEVNQWLRPLFRQEVFANAGRQIFGFGFNPEVIKGQIFNPLEGQVDTGLLMKNLAAYARQMGVEVLTGQSVQRLEVHENSVAAVVKNPVGGEEVTFTARALGVCTNAFTPSLLPNTELKPGRGQVLVTEAVEGLPWRGTFHMEEGYYYFRNYGRQVILGGGRQRDFAGETTTDIALNASIQEHLDWLLKTVLLPGRAVQVQHRWAGIMAFGPTKEPIVQRVQNRVAVGVRLGGMGVALGSRVGEQVAELLLEA